MNKVWIYKRKSVKGWWIGWYESGKRKAKALPSKALAEHFRQIKYVQLNSDVFIGTVTVDWPQMRDEYVHSKKVAGSVDASIYEVALTLRHFERLIGRCNSKQINQNAIDKYILERGKEVVRSTVNKDIRNLRAFIYWCRENRYVNGEIKIKLLREDERPVKSLTKTQIKKLLSTSKPYKTLRMRILLALGTGLRLRDIEIWRIPDIDFESSYVTTRNKKSRKSMGSRPVPVPIMAELKKYVSGLEAEQEEIFNDNFSRYRWTQIRRKLKLEDYTFHDLRKTFGSVLAQRGVSTAVIQKLLEHSSPDLTNKVYTNVDPVLRHAVDKIPVGDWL
ncbi:MAG: tyrosine-type recombinase/integrase [Planctomycetes bacterium]|nr:tyrosine-type recombinase/integrase [Planctomycetota bacterium]